VCGTMVVSSSGHSDMSTTTAMTGGTTPSLKKPATATKTWSARRSWMVASAVRRRTVGGTHKVGCLANRPIHRSDMFDTLLGPRTQRSGQTRNTQVSSSLFCNVLDASILDVWKSALDGVKHSIDTWSMRDLDKYKPSLKQLVWYCMFEQTEAYLIFLARNFLPRS